jgi:hypothetical protein
MSDSLNASSGLFVGEVMIAGFAIYMLYKVFNSNTHVNTISESLGNEYDSIHYSNILSTGPPRSDWSQSQLEEYTSACRWIVAHPDYFSMEEVNKAQAWLNEIQQNPDVQFTPQYDDIRQAAINTIRGPFPTNLAKNSTGFSDPYSQHFTTIALGIVVRIRDYPNDYPEDVKDRAVRWIQFLQYPDRYPQPTDTSPQGNNGAPGSTTNANIQPNTPTNNSENAGQTQSPQAQAQEEGRHDPHSGW